MKVVISSGHGLRVAGAMGLIAEVTEARNVVDKVAEYMRLAGIDVVVFHENDKINKTDNLNAIIAYHNDHDRDLDVSIHFNSVAGGTQDEGIGTETLYFTADDLATKVSAAISKVSWLKDRGAKKRTDLGFLSHTTRPAILIEVCFVNSRVDVLLYQEHFDRICHSIAEAITEADIPKSIDHWAIPAIQALRDAGITVNDDSRLDEPASRGEMFAMLARIVTGFHDIR